MNDLRFSFEAEPWENYLDTLKPGQAASASTLLALTDGQDEAVLEDALQELEERGIELDISDLPRSAGAGEAAVRLRHEEQLVKKGLSADDLEEGDPLRLYLEELAMTPSFGDEQLLAEKSAAGDENAMVQLTNLSLSRVVSIACEHTGKGVLLLDLIQEGSLGLWQAIRTWENGDFIVFSNRLIRFYMARTVLLQSHAGGVGQKMRTALEDYRSVDERLLSELGRNPTVEEIAEAMHVAPEAATAIGAMLENARTIAQAKKQPEPEEEEIAETQAVEDTAYFQMRQRITELLSALSAEDARLITLRYGLEGGKPLTPEETGRQLNLTPGEVVAREGAALAKLRAN